MNENRSCVVCTKPRIRQHELCERHIEAHDLRSELIDNEDKSVELERLLVNAYINRDLEQSYMRNSQNHKLAILLEDKKIVRQGKVKIPSPYHIRFKLTRMGKKIAELCYLESLLN